MRNYKKYTLMIMIVAIVFSLTGCLSAEEKDNIINTLENENIIDKDDKLIYSWADDASPIPAFDDYNYYYESKNGNYLIEIDASGDKEKGYKVYKTLGVEVTKNTWINTETDYDNGEMIEKEYTDYEITNCGTDKYYIELKVIEFKFFWTKLGERMVVTNYELN